MASKPAAKAAGGLVEIGKKYTLQSTGIWEVIRRFLAIEPNRSNGVPLNAYNRLPSPGSIDPAAYTDPVTAPAADIADNPYWKRDARRSYPRLSVVAQPDQVALLAVGSAAAPVAELVGDAGTKALVAARDAGSQPGGLAAYFEATGADAARRVLERNGGMPPLPSGQSLASGKWEVHKYELTPDQSYPEGEYPNRNFR